MKSFTVRLPTESADDVAAIARAEGQSLNATVQMAIAEAVERRRADPQFRDRLRRIVAEDQELLQRLAR
jgi:predicted transcriptional regulator